MRWSSWIALAAVGAVLGILASSCASGPKKAERLDARMRMDADYERRLEAWPVPFEARFASTRFGPTHVILSGPEGAPLLILLHAMGTNALTWAPNAAELSREYRIAAVDTIGDQGRSIARRDYPENGREYADWVADIVSSLGASRASVAGCSMGGWIATCAALYRPEAIDKAILVSPAAGIPERTTWGPMLVSIILDPSERNLRKFGSRLLGGGKAGQDWLEYFLLAATDSKSGKLGMPSKMKDAELARIAAPVLLLIGDAETIYADPAEVAARAMRTLPSCEALTVPGAGHLGHYDNPEFVDREMLRFLGPGRRP
jgi:pimeloyl-ACP methyl ester carboxylesterase